MKEENGPLIALIAFIVLAGIFGTFAYQAHNELIGDEGRESKYAEIDKRKHTIEDIEKDIKDYKDRVVNLSRSIREQNARYTFNSDLFGEYTGEYERRRKLIENAQGYDKQAIDLNGQVTAKKRETLTAINKDKTEVVEKQEKEVTEKTKAKEDSLGRQRQIGEEQVVETRRYRENKNLEQSVLDDDKSILVDLTQRDEERAEIFTESDGKVILADPVRNFVVIDIGTSSGVRNGFRFECYTMRPGNKKVVKAYLEVRHADASKSECMVLKRVIAMPKDPHSEYIAGDPEELYSPYQESGKKGASAQPLSSAKVMDISVKKLDPIVEGDLIQNPFFSPKKPLTFFIAGSKTIENDRQKSAIRYRWTEIKSVIESYGATVAADPDITVNYVIAQKNPKTDGTDPEKAQYRKAVDLGLPIVYEWELFRFLDTR